MKSLNDFVETCRARALFPLPVNRVMVACSGGMDSVFLLHLLHACREALSLDLCVVTCDHGLRPDSAADAEWVRQLAWSMGLPCHRVELRVPRGRQASESVEMAARRLRLRAFSRLVSETGADAVALGHHRDDQAETVLMRLCRGTGPRGAAGMRWSTLHGDMRLVRPLLGFTRAHIEARMRSWGRTWREDASNLDPVHARNRVRHRVLPMLCEELNPRVAEHLTAFAERQRALDDWVSAEASKALTRCVEQDRLALKSWRKLPPPLQERVILGYLGTLGVEMSEVGGDRLQGFADALQNPVTHSRVWRFGPIRLRVEEDTLRPHSDFADPGECELAMDTPLWWAPLERRISARASLAVDRKASSLTEPRRTLTAYTRRPHSPLRVRLPRQGDRYTPMGMNGSTKLSDLFINARLPKRLRERWPVVTCDGEIVWVPGFRVAESWKMGEEPGVELVLAGLPDPA